MKNILLTLMLMLSGFGWSQLTHQGCLDAGMVVFGQYSNGGASGVCIWTDDNGNIVCSWGNSGTPGLNACLNNCPDAIYYFGTGNDGKNYCENVIIPLPISLVSYTGFINELNHNELNWITDSEQNNDYYIVTYSDDGKDFRELYRLPGAGNSTQTLSYRFIHGDPNPTINYYKLIQVDYDGKQTQYGPISIDNRENKRTLIKTVNMMGQEVNENYRGLLINIYSDGTTEKIYK